MKMLCLNFGTGTTKETKKTYYYVDCMKETLSGGTYIKRYFISKNDYDALVCSVPDWSYARLAVTWGERGIESIKVVDVFPFN